MLNLSVNELKEVTGKARRIEQARVLAAMDIPYMVRPDGVVIVCRAAYMAAAGCAIKHAPRPNEPDYGAITSGT